MKKVLIVITALSTMSCGEAASKRSNPGAVVDGPTGTIFSAPQQPSSTNPGGGGNVSVGTDSNRVIGEMSNAELDALCDASQAAIERALGGKSVGEIGCLYGTLAFAPTGDGDISEICEQAVQSCSEADEQFECPFIGEDTSGCTATVAELESCLTASAAQYEKLGKLSCSTITEELLEELQDFEEPAACKTFAQKCDVGDDDDFDSNEPTQPEDANNGNFDDDEGL